MTMALMKPNYLLGDEINYELRIRGCESSKKDVSAKRKILTRLLKKTDEDAVLVDPQYNFDSEKTIIDATLEALKALISDFEGPASDSMYKRIETRLVHIAGRISRIVVSEGEDDALEYKNESHATCVELEAELEERVKPDPADVFNSTVNPPNTSSSQNTASPQPTGCNSNNSVAVYKWNLKFNGVSMSVNSFLDRVEELSIARNIDKALLFNSAIDLFSDSALIWFRRVRKQLNSWDELVKKLKADYLPSNYNDKLWDEIKSRKQGRSESAVVYISIMENLFAHLENQPADFTKLKIIKQNLLPHYISALALQDVRDLDHLISLCKKIDEAFHLRKSYTTPVKSKDLLEPELACVDNKLSSHSKVGCGSKSSSSGINCFNCNAKGHVYRECRKPRSKFCFRCGTKDHTVRTCPKCSKNE